MKAEIQSFRRHPLSRRMRWLRWRNRWPVLIWLGACVLCWWMYRQMPQSHGGAFIRGMVDGEDVSLAPAETARIRKVHVAEGQAVRKGDLLVEMDTSLIAHGITVALVDAVRIETAYGDTHQDVLQAISQRVDAMATISAEIAVCEQDYAREQARLEALRLEQARREALYADRVIDDLIRGELLPEIGDLEKAVVHYPQRLAMYRQQLAAAEGYYRGIMDWLGGEEGAPVSESIRRHLGEDQVTVLLQKARAEAELMARAYRIEAPRDGYVSAIFHWEGEVVATDIPILRLVHHPPEWVYAYLDDMQVEQLQVGQQLRVRSLHRPAAGEVAATVTAISPEVNVSTFMFSATGREVPFRAQRARLRMDGGHPFIGGEAVLLQIPPHDLWTKLLERMRSLFGDRAPDAAS